MRSRSHGVREGRISGIVYKGAYASNGPLPNSTSYSAHTGGPISAPPVDSSLSKSNFINSVSIKSFKVTLTKFC